MPKIVNHEITDDTAAAIRRYLQTASPAYDKFGNAVTPTQCGQPDQSAPQSQQQSSCCQYDYTTSTSRPSYNAYVRVITDKCVDLKLDVERILTWLQTDIGSIKSYIEKFGNVKGIPIEVRDTLHDPSLEYCESLRNASLSDYEECLERYMKYFENIMNGIMIIMYGKNLEDVKKLTSPDGTIRGGYESK